MKPTSAPSSISRNEWRFVWLTAAAVLIITSLPYLFGYLTSPPDKQFMGLMQDVPDHGQYLAWWNSFQHAFLASNKLTPEPNQALFFNLLWWFLAQITRFTGLGYPVIYQILRWGGGIALMVAVYRLIALFLADVSRRRLAFLLVILSSGLGWVLVILKYTLWQGTLFYPQLLYNAESNYFLCMLGYPHFTLAAALMCVVFENVVRGWKENSIRRLVIAGGWSVVLGWMHAYDLIIIYAIVGVFFLLGWWQRRKFPVRFFWGAAILAGLSAPAALYSFLLTSLDPLWKQVLSQFSNAGVFMPLPPYLFFLLGIPLFLAVATLVKWVREKKWNDERRFIGVWFILGFCLLYIPTDFQIHMLNTWQIPIMILAAECLYDGLAPWIVRVFPRPWLGLRAAQWAALGLLVLVLPTNLYLWSWRFIELNRHDVPYYLEKGYIQAMDWLQKNSAPESVVLSSLTVGQYIPALSGNTAFLAHWANTVNFYDKEARVNAFFDGSAANPQREKTLSEFHVGYVIYGPAEKQLGAFSPGSVPWLAPVFQSDAVSVYQVSQAALAGAKTQP